MYRGIKQVRSPMEKPTEVVLIRQAQSSKLSSTQNFSDGLKCLWQNCFLFPLWKMHASEKMKPAPKIVFILLEFSSPIPSLVFQRKWRAYTPIKTESFTFADFLRSFSCSLSSIDFLSFSHKKSINVEICCLNYTIQRHEVDSASPGGNHHFVGIFRSKLGGLI